MSTDSTGLRTRSLGDAELLRELCFIDYVCGLTIPQIAKDRGISRKTVDSWRTSRKWVEKRAELVARLGESAEGALALLVKDNCVPFARDVVGNAHAAHRQLARLLKNKKLTAEDLQRLTGSAKRISDTAGKLLLPHSGGRSRSSGPKGPALTLRVLMEGPQRRLAAAAGGEVPADEA